MEELVKKIKTYFGLNIYETKVWLALIKKGIASAGEIAVISGVPRSRTYDVLESLEKQGFAIQKIGKPVKYIAVKPSIIIEKLKNDTVHTAEEKVAYLSKLKETTEYVELQELHKSGFAPTKYSSVSGAIRGSEIYNHLREILENAEKEVLICSAASDLLHKKKVFSSVFETLQKHGVRTKVALNGSDEEIKEVQEIFGIKTIKAPTQGRFFIIDKSQVLFYVNEKANSVDDAGIWLSSPFFAEAMSKLFETALAGFKQN
ncbi:MAG: helix-turn-helix domain-containing protein [Nanoarchaeota archaeon]